jgi:zinc transport system permease protein
MFMGVLELVGSHIVMRAIAAALIASVLSAVVGSFTVSRGLSTMGAAIAHSSLAGAILGFLLGVEPLIGAVILSLIFALFISKGGRTRTRRDMILGVTFGLSAAIAAMSLSFMRAYTTTAMNYLIGDVMGVSNAEILLLFAFTFAFLR